MSMDSENDSFSDDYHNSASSDEDTSTEVGPSLSRDLPGLREYTSEAIAGASRANRSRRKAKKRLGTISHFYHKHIKAPFVQLSEESQKLADAGVLVFDPSWLRSEEGEPVLWMNPQLFFPKKSKTATKDILSLLMYMGEIMCASRSAQQRGYTFIADLTEWRMANFSVGYASAWFGMQQSIPLVINRFIVLNAPGFFPGIFKVLKGFMSPSFTAKWLFTNYEGVLELFPASALPDTIGGSVRLEKTMLRSAFMGTARVSHFAEWDGVPLQQSTSVRKRSVVEVMLGVAELEHDEVELEDDGEEEEEEEGQKAAGKKEEVAEAEEQGIEKEEHEKVQATAQQPVAANGEEKDEFEFL